MKIFIFFLNYIKIKFLKNYLNFYKIELKNSLIHLIFITTKFLFYFFLQKKHKIAYLNPLTQLFNSKIITISICYLIFKISPK